MNLLWPIAFTGISVLLFSCTNNPSRNTDPNTADRKAYAEIPDNTIINLYDAFGEVKPGMEKDFGFSCLVKYKGNTILFDAGSNADIFRKNVDALNIDLTEIDYVVASHAHFDHINGFDYLLEVHPEVRIYFPFDLFWGANFPFNLTGQDPAITDSLEQKMQYFGGDFQSYRFNQTGRFWKANIEFVKGNKEIAPGIKLIATSSPYMGYFNKYPTLDLDHEALSIPHETSGNVDFINLQELSLSLKTEKGEVLIVGCSHSTVEKIIIDTRLYTNSDIALVYGGYHLLPYDREILTALSDRLQKELNVKKVAPAHCTGHLAFKILQNRFKEDYVFAGLGEVVKF
jgi:7,8-dihydropterin-6-yl-methyl-4-(beta-D-ribofuranosyl)aminobenzene 5'-phosphate synthase